MLSLFLTGNVYVFLAAVFASALGLRFFALSVTSHIMTGVDEKLQARVMGLRVFLGSSAYSLGKLANIWPIQLPGTGRWTFFGAMIMDLIILIAAVIFLRTTPRLSRSAKI